MESHEVPLRQLAGFLSHALPFDTLLGQTSFTSGQVLGIHAPQVFLEFPFSFFRSAHFHQVTDDTGDEHHADEEQQEQHCTQFTLFGSHDGTSIWW